MINDNNNGSVVRSEHSANDGIVSVQQYYLYYYPARCVIVIQLVHTHRLAVWARVRVKGRLRPIHTMNNDIVMQQCTIINIAFYCISSNGCPTNSGK